MSNARAIYHALRRAGRPFAPRFVPLADVHHTINWRAELAGEIAGQVEDGRIGVIRDGMDCDCTQYHRESVVDFTGLVAFARDEAKHYAYLDGPEATCFVAPSRIDRERNASRDLALEAFEDGHAHVVHAGAF